MGRFIRGRLAVGLLCSLLLSSLVSAQPDGGLKKGVLLVAAPQLSDARFQRSVILVVDHGQKGTMGFRLNQPTQMPLSYFVPALKKKNRPDIDVLFQGGPIDVRNVYVLTRTRRVHPSMHQVTGNVYAAKGLRALGHMLDQLAADETLRAFVGYVGWGPRQLEAEVQRGDWLVVAADEGLIFSPPDAPLWERLTKGRLGEWL